MNVCSALFHPAAGSTLRPGRCRDMRRILLIGLILALTATAADARRRHHRHHYRMHEAPVMMVAPGIDAPDMRGSERRGGRGESSFIPADWKLQPEDPNFSG